jgi:hypothetical protein
MPGHSITPEPPPEGVGTLAEQAADMVARTREGDIARFLRKAQWALDEMAHRLPEGRCRAEDKHDLADMLDQVAALMREHAGPRPVVIDVEPAEEVSR